MKIFNPNFFDYFLILITVTSVFFITGGVISRFIYSSKSRSFRVFFNLLNGYIFWIFITAFLFTKGNTIFIVFPFSILFWKIIFRRKLTIHNYSSKTFLNDSKEFFKEAWFLLFIYILFIIKHILANGVIESDYLVFSNISYTMKQTGFEGINFGMFASYFVNPYHYSDMWLTSFVAEIFKTNYYHSTIFISIPILLFIVYSGTIALIKEVGIRFFNKENLKYAYLYACIIFILGGLDYPFIREYMAGTISLIQIPKTSIIYVIYILALIFLMRDELKYSLFVILLLTSLYTQTVFFVLPATGILILISVFKNYKEGGKYLLYYLIIVGITGLFYYLNSKLSNVFSPISYDNNKIYEGIATFPIQLIKKTIRLIIVYLPFLLLFLFSIKKSNFNLLFHSLRNSNNFIIVLFFLLTGYFFSLLFSRSLYVVEQDYAQVLYNGLLPALAVLSFMAIIFSFYEFSTIKNYKYITLRFILVLLILNGLFLQHYRDPRYWGYLKKIDVDKDFYYSLAENIEDEDKIATFQDFEPPKGTSWFQYNYQLYPNLRRIANFNNNGIYFPECINVFEMDTTKSEARKYYYKKSPFIQFMDSIKRKEKEIKPSYVQCLFLEKHNFNFIILPYNHKTPVEVKTLIVDSIIRNDGLRIYKLNTD